MSTFNQFLEQDEDKSRVRAGEGDRTWFRNQRIFCVNGNWFFACRDGLDNGPYPDRREAEAALTQFLRDHATAGHHLADD